jgi:hypothetical protein
MSTTVRLEYSDHPIGVLVLARKIALLASCSNSGLCLTLHLLPCYVALCMQASGVSTVIRTETQTGTSATTVAM